MRNSKEFPVPEQMRLNAGIHCAALVIADDRQNINSDRPRFALPSEKYRNGTLTFFKTNHRVFGVTCWHVVQQFRRAGIATGDTSRFSLRTMVNGFHVIVDRFVQPKARFGDPEIDIAIREIKPEFVAAIGKEPIDLDRQPAIPRTMRHAYAVGYPESLKRRIDEQHRYRIAMPLVEILAEIDHVPEQRFMISSELPSTPEYTDYSGMSGGPIFWTTECSYGIVGIAYESNVLDGEDGRSVVCLFGEYADARAVKQWTVEALK